MEGLSGEGTRRRREYTEDTEVRIPTAEEMERVKERILERIDLSEKREVSTKEYADTIVREISEEEKNEENVTTGSEESLEDLERMREFCESIERRKAEALEAIDLSRREEVVEDSPEEQEKTGESRFEDIRTQEEYDRAIEKLRGREVEEGDISRKMEDVLEKLERMERAGESTEDKIRDALENIDEQEKRPEREASAGETSESQDETRESHFGEIRTREEYNQALENHSELKLRKSYESDEKEAMAYFERRVRGEDVEKPTVVEKIENLELRRMYEAIREGPPEVRIESMKDVDDLLEKYPEEQERTGFEERYRHCEVYFEVKDKHEEKRDDLAEQYSVSHTFIGYCRTGIEPYLIKKLREHEEERLMKEWANDSPQIEGLKIVQEFETREVIDRGEVVKRIEPHGIREALEKRWASGGLSSERVASAIEQMFRNESSEKHPIQYADLRSEIDSKQSEELERFIQSNRREIEETLTQKFHLEHNRARVAYIDDRMYTWIPKNRADELVGAYETEFYYFKDRKEVGYIVDELRKQIGLKESPYESLKHLNEVLKQLNTVDDRVPARKKPVSELSSRLEGKVVRFYLDATDRKLSDLEGNVKKVSGINGQAGIENPKFPEGGKLETLKARLAAIIASDCHLRESGRIGYNEKNLERIQRVQEILNNFGDIPLEPKFRKGTHEVHIRNQIGLIMIHEGMTPGDKTIQNPHLPNGYQSWSVEARRAYLEELIPEDGGFDSRGYFYWNRQVALYIKDDQNKFGFQSKVGNNEINLVKEFGGHTEGLVEQRVVSYLQLADLQEHDDSKVAQSARKLISVINANRSNLVDDERNIAESLGIKITVRPEMVRYYPTSEKLSVRWNAITASKDDTIRWADKCPPNDVRKRNEVESWLRKIAEKWLDENEWHNL
jgi:hypothetical protein